MNNMNLNVKPHLLPLQQLLRTLAACSVFCLISTMFVQLWHNGIISLMISRDHLVKRKCPYCSVLVVSSKTAPE